MNDNSYAIDPEMLQDFLAEASEHLERVESDCLLLEQQSDNRELLNSLFRAFHTIKGLAGFVEQPSIQEVAHHTETLLDHCRKAGARPTKLFIDLVLRSADVLKTLCNALATDSPASGNLVAEHLQVLDNWDCSTLATAPEPGSVVETVASEPAALEVASVLPESVNGNYMRVASPKVDSLIDMLGELLILQSVLDAEMVKRCESNDPVMQSFLRMYRITKNMQELALSLRMVSLKATFQKITRIARDTIAQLDRSVNVTVIGEETEIDRGVADKLLDPLLHLVRNAIAHGIEGSEERTGLGKDPYGNVTIKAYSRRGYVYIQVADDGQGIDGERVYAKALRKGLVADEPFTADEKLSLIFLPGLSTKDEVDAVSGRGVGLDVVKAEVSKLGGKLDFVTEPGRGSTFTLKIPINLAIINGTIVDIGPTSFIIPTLHIKKIFAPTAEQWVTQGGRKNMVRLRDDIIPLVRTARAFGSDLSNPELIVVLEHDQQLRALPVTAIRDRKDIVVKSLSEDFRDLDHFVGASILGDGKVCLIVDVESFFKKGGANE